MDSRAFHDAWRLLVLISALWTVITSCGFHLSQTPAIEGGTAMMGWFVGMGMAALSNPRGSKETESSFPSWVTWAAMALFGSLFLMSLSELRW